MRARALACPRARVSLFGAESRDRTTMPETSDVRPMLRELAKRANAAREQADRLFDYSFENSGIEGEILSNDVDRLTLESCCALLRAALDSALDLRDAVELLRETEG